MEPSNPYQPPAKAASRAPGMPLHVEPGSTIDLDRSLRFFFNDPKWVSKLLIGSLFYLLAFVFVGGLVIAGYMMEVIRRSARGEAYPLPEWDNIGRMFIEGATVVGAYLAIILPTVLVFMVPFVAMGTLAEGQDASPVIGLMMAALMLVVFVGYIAVLLYFSAAVVRMALERRFSGAFDFAENVAFLRRNLKNVILAVLFYMLASFLSQFGLILFCIGILPAAFWALCVGAYAFGEVAFRDPERAQAPAP